jgi:hypothetical protein
MVRPGQFLIENINEADDQTFYVHPPSFYPDDRVGYPDEQGSDHNFYPDLLQDFDFL